MTVNQRALLYDTQYGLWRRMWSHRLFRRMLARQAIDLEAASRHGTEEMLFRALDHCSHCEQKDVCHAWLASPAPRASYVRFCPNSETIEALRIIAC